jgi:hypothetical protein
VWKIFHEKAATIASSLGLVAMGCLSRRHALLLDHLILRKFSGVLVTGLLSSNFRAAARRTQSSPKRPPRDLIVCIKLGSPASKVVGRSPSALPKLGRAAALTTFKLERFWVKRDYSGR